MKILLRVLGVIGAIGALGISLVTIVTGSWHILTYAYIVGVVSAFVVGVTEDDVNKMGVVEWITWLLVIGFGWWAVATVTINLQREKSPLGIIVLVLSMLVGVWLTRLV